MASNYGGFSCKMAVPQNLTNGKLPKCTKLIVFVTKWGLQFELLADRRTRYLVSDNMTEYDCELMPRLHHMRIVGQRLLGFDLPHKFTYLWNYVLTAYRTAAFIESCPADQDIILHYKVRERSNFEPDLQFRTAWNEIVCLIEREIKSIPSFRFLKISTVSFHVKRLF